jgi:hypothetical protein
VRRQAIEKKYDAQIRTIRKNEVAADNAARKNRTAESDASFETQISQLQVQERADMRARLLRRSSSRSSTAT